MKNALFYLGLLMITLNLLAFGQKTIVTTGDPFGGSTIFSYSNGVLIKVIEDSQGFFEAENVKTSPNGQYIGAISSSKVFLRDASGRDFIDHQLLVLDLNGRIILTVPNAQRFAWSPDSKRIVVITGTDFEGFSFTPSSITILDVLLKTEKVFPALREFDIEWAAFDNMIYTTNFSKVFQIDPNNGKRANTIHKGIYFSPDGNYYFKKNYEGATFGIFERLTNREVTPNFWRDSLAEITFQRWLPYGSTLVAGSATQVKKAIDLRNNIEKAKFSGLMLGFETTSSKIITLEEFGTLIQLQTVKPQEIKIDR